MKGGFAAAAMAALAGGAAAMNHGHGHAHNLFAQKRGEELAECSPVITVITGPPTLVPAPPPVTSSLNTTTSIVTPTEIPVTSTLHQPVPTPEPITCPTPGTYTFTATTVTLSETTTVCGATSTHVTSGTHTLGGVTTVVETATTVTCPVATVTTSDGVVTSTVINTEYVCPSAGTYTIAPTTITVTEECDVDVPVPTVYPPGTYTAPEVVITVTETGFVTVCPYTSSETPTPTPTPEPSTSAAPPPPPPAPSSSAPPPPPPQPEPEQEEEEEEEETSTVSTVSFGGGFFEGSFGSDGGHYGMTYTPYDGASGNCKSKSEVDDDIAEIKADGFTVVRVYSTDCDTLPNVGAACANHGIEMMIGVFVRETGCSYNSPDIKEQVDAIAAWGQFDLVKLVIIGNEALMNGFCSASELAELISVVKEKIPEYSGPFTIAETTNIWLDSTVTGALCDAVDFVGANVHPYFNFETLASAAGMFVQGQLDILDAVCPGKQSVNLECGWPTGGNCNGSACPGKDAQAEALESIRDAVGSRTVFFAYDNDFWKEPGECNCEQSWGCRDFFSSS